MALKLTNLASALLAVSIGTEDTEIAVATGFGARFPALSVGDWCPLVVINAEGTIEIMHATARTGDVISVIRAREGTIAHSFEAGDRVELRITEAVWAEQRADLAAAAAKAASDLSAAVASLNSVMVKLTGNQGIGGVKTFTSIPVGPNSNPTANNQLTRKLYVDNTVSAAVAPKANDNAVVKLTGAQTVAGEKTFSSTPVTTGGDPTANNQLARKAYVDTKGPPEASHGITVTGKAIAIDTDNALGRGSYALARLTSATESVPAGNTTSGSNLRAHPGGTSGLPGNWRNVSGVTLDNDDFGLWIRI